MAEIVERGEIVKTMEEIEETVEEICSGGDSGGDSGEDRGGDSEIPEVFSAAPRSMNLGI